MFTNKIFKQRKQFLNTLGCVSPHLPQHLLRLFLLLVTVVGGVTSSWADEVVVSESKTWTVTSSNISDGTSNDTNGRTGTLGLYSSNGVHSGGYLKLDAGETAKVYFNIPANTSGTLVVTYACSSKDLATFSVKLDDTQVYSDNTTSPSSIESEPIAINNTTASPAKISFLATTKEYHITKIQWTVGGAPSTPSVGTIKEINGTTTTWDFTKVTQAMGATLTDWTEDTSNRYFKNPAENKYWTPSWCDGIAIGVKGGTEADKVRVYYGTGTNAKGVNFNGNNGAIKVTIPAGANTLKVYSAQTIVSTNVALTAITGGYSAIVAPGQEVVLYRNSGATSITKVITTHEDIPTYTITYYLNGHGEAIDDDTEATALPATLPAPTATGYEFGGWYTDEGLTEAAVAGAAISANTTLYAKWTAKEYEIKYFDQGQTAFSGTHGDNHPTRHTYGTATTLVNPTKAEYTFGGWFTTTDCSGEAITVLGATDYTGQINLYAKWNAAASSECEVTNVKRGETALAYDEATKTYTLTIPFNDRGDRTGESIDNAYGITFEISNGATVTSSDSKGSLLSSPYKVFKSCGASAGSTNQITLYVTAEDETTKAEYKIKLVRGNNPVTGITLDHQKLYLEYNTSATLTATVTPDDATNKDITWTSSNKDNATVTNGVVKAKGAYGGSAVVTATAADGSGVSADCNVYLYRFSETGTTSKDFAIGQDVSGIHPQIYTVFTDESGNVSFSKGDFTVTSTNESVIRGSVHGLQGTNNEKVVLDLTLGGSAGTATLSLVYNGSNENYRGKTCTIVYNVSGAAIGATDCSDAYGANKTSDATALTDGQTVKFSFTNHNGAKGNSWNNWNLVTGYEAKSDQGNATVLRADSWYWGSGEAGTHCNQSGDWSAMTQDNLDGAHVDVEVTKVGNKVTYYAVMTLKDGRKAMEDLTYTYDNAPTLAWLRVDESYITDLNVTTGDITYRTVTISKTPDAGGTISAKVKDTNTDAGTQVINGTTVTFTAAPANGYEFDGWYAGEELVSSEAVYSTSVTTNINLTAKFNTFAAASTKWVFEEGNGNGTYPANGMDLVIDGSSWNGSGIKLNGDNAYFTFTPNADGVLTVKGIVSKSGTSYLNVTQNGSAAENTGLSDGVATYNVVAGQPIIIKRASSNIRIAEIEFTPTGNVQLSAPQISVENGIVTFTNPNAATTLFFKYDRTKEGEIGESNFDGSSTLEVKQIELPYGEYPAEWIQAQVGDNSGKSSAITKYAEAVTVAPPVPVMTKEGTVINFTVPTGCFVEFHVGASDAEAIAVYSTTATVELNTSTKKMTIKGTGHSTEDKTYDVTDLYIKTVAEYDRKDDGVSDKGYIGSELIKVTPEATDVTSATIPEALEIYVGQKLTITPTVVTISGNNIGNLHKSWVLVSGSDYLTLSDANRTTSSVIGKKSNTSDNATAKLKVTVDGVESNECTVTIKRTPLAVRADHVALSHNGNEARTLHAIAYNPYTRVAIGKKGNVEDGNLTITTAPKSGTSAFATSSGNKITPNGNDATGTETWVVTVAPKTDADKVCYTAGTAEIQVTCRDYLYAYNTSVPATTPTARPVENESKDVALNYYAGHNPADCRTAADDEPLKVWGDKNRGPQEQDLALYASGKQKPYARIHGWDGIKNVAEPTMNSLSEQHDENPVGSYVYNGNSNGKFTYKAYSYYGDHNEFDVPVMGSFYRFYPEKNGTLIAYLCVNGQFSDSDMDKLSKDNATQTGYASRYTYFLDPYASSMQIENPTVQPTSTVQTGFFYYTLDNCKNTANLTRDIVELLNHWSAWGNDEKDANGNLVIPVKSTSYGEKKTSYTIEDVDWDLFKKLAQDPVGIFHQPIANGDGSFRVITKTYVRCEVHVEKGRVYYVSPTGTKTRMAGVEFIPDGADPVAENVNYYNGTISAQSNTAPYNLPSNANQSTGFQNDVTMTAGNYYNVTLADRTFKAGQWYSFCMPFDVPEKQIHDIFGKDAVTIHFDNVSVAIDNGDTKLKMNFWSHFYDQIRAGRPIMIKMPETFPSSSQATSGTDTNGKAQLTNVTFKHVKYIPVEESSLYISNGEWTFKGSYTPVQMDINAVIINNTQFYHYKTTPKTLAGNRAWIQGPSDPVQAAKYNLVTTFSMFNEDEGDTITGIEEVLSEMGMNVKTANDNVYNINGQMVDKSGDISNLPKGIYIVNGKKMVVK